MKHDDNKFQVYTVKNPKGIILFLHGALEYPERYQQLFCALNAQKYLVITVNHPDHGKNHCGNYHLENLTDLEKNAMDLKLFAEENYPHLEHHVIAHSLGTIITRNLLMHRNLKFGKVILSGTFNPPRTKINLGKATINLIIKMTTKDHASSLANYLMFGEFKQRMYVKYRTTNWINSDSKLYQLYKEDQACNQKLDNMYIKSVLDLTQRAISPAAIATLKSHEYLILNGMHDPVNNFGKELGRFSKHSRIDYHNMRHEIFLEKNNHVVYNDIINFLDK